ncbi:Alkaline phosphatase D-related protein [Penicillium malachiteum]|uniref:Alkaline phosphatase D-related protein n=1 Tax=Penicillium malachiteum TaxID=1324776 RepID=A0AAD6MRL2_9EURO|nr:Alkaline phosphatase D-related protein [Penicillium malachiteum]
MVSLLRGIAATSSATIRFFAFVLLRWIPGWPFAPIVFTSLVIYLSSILSLVKDEPPSGDRPRKDGKTSTKRAHVSSASESCDSALKTLLTGLPSKRSPVWTWITALINIVVSCLALDFLVRGLVVFPSNEVTFSRIGYVSPTTANLVFREPDTAQLPVVVSYQEASHEPNKWVQEGTVYMLNNSTDFTKTVKFQNLKPGTHYRYRLSNNKTGSFVTAPRPGSREASRMSFVTSSCLKPNFPYNILSHPLRVPGIEIMTEALAKLPELLKPSFMLFLGDFIYIDVPFRFGASMNHYRSEYRRIYSSPSWAFTSKNSTAIDLPWIHSLDDHEIENDWSKGNKTAPYPAAADPFIHYHVSANPPVPAKPFAHPDDVTYFSFVNGPASFFMLDTRTYRSEPSQTNSTILGYAQLQSLLEYLATPEPAGVHWKIVSSSVPFTKNWHVGTTDTWGGFLNERRSVFEAMWRAERELGIRIILLSGDRHEFAATRFPDPALELTSEELQPNTPGLGVHEFSVGPLSMFYLPIRSYRQTDTEDVAVKYAPDGNSKFGLIDIAEAIDEVDASVRNSVLTYSLYVGGEVVWKYQLSVPAQRKNTTKVHPAGHVLEDRLLSWDGPLKMAFGSLSDVVELGIKKATWVYEEALSRLRSTGRLG